jgi:glycolate oxidase iron-sulfur subunit
MSARSPEQSTVLAGTPLAVAESGLDLCVHCGFCLQACPTYLAARDENDSPRGRLFLMRSALDGDLPIDDPAMTSHIDRCLGCRACETVCPSGVPYGHLLEATRATMAQARPIPRIARLFLGAMAGDQRRRILFLLARLVRASGVSRWLARLPGRIGFAAALLESTRAVLRPRHYPSAGDASRGTAAVLSGCVMDGLFRHTNRATARALEMNGFSVIEAPEQGCCGALHAHAGDLGGARALARRNIAAFERSGAAVIAVNAAGCGAMMKEYGHLLRDDPAWRGRAESIAGRTRDVTELLAAAGPRAGASLPVTVAYDAPCHLLHAQRVNTAPLAVLQSIPDLAIAPLADAEQCCGGAGIYNLLEPRLSAEVLSPKLVNISRTPARLIATGNPGCLMQIGAGLLRARSPTRCVHPVDLLDASYAAAHRS